MGNIILNESLCLSTTKISVEGNNQIEQLSFYISNKYGEFDICVAITDSFGVFDIVPLTYLRTDKNYKIYNIDCKNELRIKSGKCKIIIFLFDKRLENCKSSGNLDINLDIENYNLFHHTYLNKKVVNEVSDYYDKIVKMTNLNIEIYDKIQEEVRK
jgi:hypothetical protein